MDRRNSEVLQVKADEPGEKKTNKQEAYGKT